MYQLGMFRKTLSSRRRLRITTLCAIGGLYLVFLGVGLFIRHLSLWDFVNIPLIIVLYMITLVVGYLMALTLGDIFFAGPWREKMAHGGKFIPEKLEDQTALLKNKSIYFILIWGISIALLVIACDFGSSGNIHWYQTTGSMVMSLRSSDASDRVNVLKALANAYHSRRWEDAEIRSYVVSLVGDSNSEVSSWASYIAGRALMTEASENLMGVLKSEDYSEHARSEAVISLGRMEWKSSRGLLLSVLRESFEKNHADIELVPSILFAFYLMNDPIAAQVTIQMMDRCLGTLDCSSEVLQYGFFYLKSLRVKDAAALSFRYLESDKKSAEMTCYASDILRWTSSKKDVPALKREFEKADSQVECPVVFRKYHEEPGIILFERDMLRALFLRSVGNIKDPADFDWMWMIGSNAQENVQTRKVAEIYTRALQAREQEK